jgi:excisionase family DNA binding protein
MLPDPNDQPVLTVEQAAEILKVSRSAAYRAAQDGSIPTIRIGRTVRVPTAGLLALLGLNGHGR